MKGTDQVHIEMVNASRLGEPQWKRLAKLWTQLGREADPYGATITAEWIRSYYTTKSPAFTTTRWVAWEDKDPVGIAVYSTFNTKENAHLVQLFFGVREDRRRRGIATRILRPASEKAESDGRSLLMFGTADRAPSGGAVAERLGARHVFTSIARPLKLEGVDRGQLRRWLEEGPRRAGDIRLEFWEGSFPKEDKEDVAYLLNSIGNDMPRMEMSMEDMEFTPDQVWGDRQRNIETGQRYWTYVARDPQTSKLVGFTEVTWRPETLGEDGHLWQADTGVLKDYRRRGIGRWLKVAMLDRILRKFAEARFITTESAEVNEPMHSLNRSLGFKVYNKFWSWELELTRLRNYLDQKRSIPS